MLFQPKCRLIPRSAAPWCHCIVLEPGSRRPMPIDSAKHPHIQKPLAQAEKMDPGVEKLVTEVIGRVADKWTMIIIDALAEHGELRFSQLEQHVPGISQKMLTQTLRGLEREGLLVRTVHAEVPPRVQYRLTELGLSLGAAFCGVWVWAEQNLSRIEHARREYSSRQETNSNG